MTDLSIEATAMSREQIRSFALQIRKVLGLERQIYGNVAALLEFVLPSVIEGFVYDIRSKAEMGNDHGLAKPDDTTVVLREDVYERALDGHGRDRMTVLHEIGHLLLHKADRMSHRRASGPMKAFVDPEWQAKAFAGEFLVPAHLMAELHSVSAVAKACGVSLDAARFQLKTYEKEGLIPKGQIKDLAS